MRTKLEQDVIETDVVVVGAGYAGLSAALRLVDEGVDCVVLEGSGRVGGRVLTEKRAGAFVVDHGGQWVGPTQKNFLSLAERFDCPIFPTWEAGDHVELWHDGSRVLYDGAAPDEGDGIADYSRITELLDAMATTVDLEQPWLTPQLELWDGMTAEVFFRAETGDDGALRRLALTIQGVWACEPSEISLFHVVFYIAAAGGYEQLMETRGCAQDSRFVRGAGALALAVAARLGSRVRLDERVIGIEQDGEGVSVRTSGPRFAARRIIVAVPPPAVARISFGPALPPARRGWLAHHRMGSVAKIHAIYPRAFWRSAGLSGIATLYGDGPVGVVFDNSPPDGSVGALVAFVYADRVAAWSQLSADSRRAAVLAQLSSVVGADAGSPLDYTEKIWPQDEFARGGYEAYAMPGAWTGHGLEGWRAPVGRVHWAGAETASRWNGYIDGAIESGHRAAEEVLSAEAAGH